MSRFAQQPIFCPVCGEAGEGDPERPWCYPECTRERDRRKTLYILGKPYTPPHPEQPEVEARSQVNHAAPSQVDAARPAPHQQDKEGE